MTIIDEIPISAAAAQCGRTRHIRNGEVVSVQVRSISLATVDGANGVYAFYYDENRNELNDLYFDTLAEARRHIEWEFHPAEETSEHKTAAPNKDIAPN